MNARCARNLPQHFNGCTCTTTFQMPDPSPAGSSQFGSLNDPPAPAAKPAQGIRVFLHHSEMTPEVLERIGARRWPKTGAAICYYLNDRTWWKHALGFEVTSMGRNGVPTAATLRGEPLSDDALAAFLTTSTKGVRFSIPERGGEPVVAGVNPQTEMPVRLGICTAVNAVNHHDDF